MTFPSNTKEKKMFDEALSILKENNIEPQYHEEKLMIDIILCEKGAILYDWFIKWRDKK